MQRLCSSSSRRLGPFGPPPGLPLVLMLAWAGAGCVGTERNGPASEPGPAASASVAFTDVTEEAGLGGFRHHTGAAGDKWMPEIMGSGAGFVDYDGDGWLDVALVGGGGWTPAERAGVRPLRLFRNGGDGSFREVTEEAGLGEMEAYGFGIAAADYDNDGDADLFLTTLEENLLFRNDGGRFAEVGREAGLADRAEWSTAAVFLDADRDGHLDLFVGNYVVWSPTEDIYCTSDGRTKDYCTPHQYRGVPGRFYHNDGDGTFSDWTDQVGLEAGVGKTLGAAELDVEGDGWPDLAVANDKERNLLLRNRGDGTFRETGVPSGIAYDADGRARAGMGIDAGVVDDSGEPTVFIGNFSDEMVGVFQHRGDGLFVDRGPASGVGVHSLPSLTFGLLLFDVDLDADLDLLLANGHLIEHVAEIQAHIAFRQPAQLFLNDGRGSFALASGVAALDRPMLARGAAVGDVDRDGDPDVLLTENGGPVHLLRNDLVRSGEAGPHVLRVHLAGREGNRDALGGRVAALAGGQWQERRVRTGGSYLSQSETALTFGLGAVSTVDTLRIVWPGGREEVFTGVGAGEVRVVEGEGLRAVDPEQVAQAHRTRR